LKNQPAGTKMPLAVAHPRMGLMSACTTAPTSVRASFFFSICGVLST